MSQSTPAGVASRVMLLARVLLLLSAAFWLLFAVLSRWAEGFTTAGLPTLATRAGAIIVTVVIAWRWPLAGGWLLLLIGLLLFGGAFEFARGPSLLVRLMLAGPPGLVGALLLVAASSEERQDSRTVGSGAGH